MHVHRPLANAMSKPAIWLRLYGVRENSIEEESDMTRLLEGKNAIIYGGGVRLGLGRRSNICARRRDCAPASGMIVFSSSAGTRSHLWLATTHEPFAGADGRDEIVAPNCRYPGVEGIGKDTAKQQQLQQ